MQAMGAVKRVKFGIITACLFVVMAVALSGCTISDSNRVNIGMSVRVHRDGSGVIEASVILPESVYKELLEYSTVNVKKYKFKEFIGNGEKKYSTTDIVYFDDEEDMRQEMKKLSSRLKVVNISSEYGYSSSNMARRIGISYRVYSNEKIKEILSKETFWHKGEVEDLKGDIIKAELVVQLDSMDIRVPGETKSYVDSESGLAKIQIVSRDEKDTAGTVIGDSGSIGSVRYKGNGFVKKQSYEPGEFSDVNEDSWYFDYVRRAYEYGIVGGVSDTRFNPNGPLTIAQALKITASIAAFYYNEGDVVEAYAILDRPWYYKYGMYLIDKGIMESSGQFGDDYNRVITRGEFCQLLSEIFPNTEYLTDSRVIWDGFKDVETDSEYYTAIERLRLSGVVSGYVNGEFGLNDGITRVQVCKFICNLIDMENSSLSDIASWFYDWLT